MLDKVEAAFVIGTIDDQDTEQSKIRLFLGCSEGRDGEEFCSCSFMEMKRKGKRKSKGYMLRRICIKQWFTVVPVRAYMIRD